MGMMAPMIDHKDIEVGDVITVESPGGQWAVRARVIGIFRSDASGSVFTLHGPLENIAVGHPDGDFVITERRRP